MVVLVTHNIHVFSSSVYARACYSAYIGHYFKEFGTKQMRKDKSEHRSKVDAYIKAKQGLFY